MDMLMGNKIAEAGLTDWRKLAQGLHARYVVDDFGTGAWFVVAVGEAGERAYALFGMGTREAGGYEGGFTWYRRAENGKGAPRYFDHLDWDGDGKSEVLLDVLGTGSRWFAGLSRRGDTWVRSFEDPCGAPTG